MQTQKKPNKNAYCWARQNSGQPVYFSQTQQEKEKVCSCPSAKPGEEHRLLALQGCRKACPIFLSQLRSGQRRAMAPHSSTLAWKIPWTEEPGRLQSIGSLRVGHDWANSLSLFTFMHWRRKWQPTPLFLPGESQGRRSLVGCRLWDHRIGHDPGTAGPGGLPSMGSRRVRHDWSDLTAAAAEAT